MAKRVSSYSTGNIQSGTPKASQVATLLNGVFVGYSASDEIGLADYRAAQGPVPAVGVLIENVQQKDGLGNVARSVTRVSFVPGSCVVDGFTGLTAGAYYYLGASGGISAARTPSAAATGDIDQVVGIAMTSTKLLVQIGGCQKHA